LRQKADAVLRGAPDDAHQGGLIDGRHRGGVCTSPPRWSSAAWAA